MTDADLLALNIAKEAGGEVPDGKAAIARIVKNRVARHFYSDGTVTGTVLRKDQFSWAWFAFETLQTGTGMHKRSVQKYVRVADTFPEAAKIAQDALDALPRIILTRYIDVAASVMAGTYHGALYDKLTDDAVSYLNPRIISHMPAWATPDKLVCTIGHHDFYRA